MNELEVLIADSAIQEIEQIPDASQGTVEEAIERIVENPVRAGTRLKGVGRKDRPIYVLGVGPYRVFYSIDRGLGVVTIVKISSRGDRRF